MWIPNYNCDILYVYLFILILMYMYMFSNEVRTKRAIKLLLGWSLFSPSSRTNFFCTSHSSTPRLRELRARMLLVKGTPTLKSDFSTRHSVYLVLDDDVPDSWNLLWPVCYWAYLRIESLIKNTSLSVWFLISLVSLLLECNGPGQF